MINHAKILPLVVKTGDKLTTSVAYTGDKIMTSVADTSETFNAGVSDTYDKNARNNLPLPLTTSKAKNRP